MTNRTQLQQAMLDKIRNDPFYEESGETWLDQIIETNTDKGVFTSLLNANLVWVENDSSGKVCGLVDTE